MQAHWNRFDFLALSNIHDGHRASEGKSIFPVNDDRRAIGIVREILTGGWAPTFIADIGILALNYHTIWNIAYRNLSDERGRRCRKVDHAERVRHVQCYISSLVVSGNCNTARIDRLRIVIRPPIGRRFRQIDSLFVSQKARIPVHIRDDDIVIVLTEE